MFNLLGTYEDVEWGQPINWSHSLNRGLTAWFIAAPGRFFVGSSKWLDLTKAYNGSLITGPSSATWKNSLDRIGGQCSIHMPASDSYVQVPHDTRLNLSETASSVAFWVKCPYAAADFCAWLDKGRGDAVGAHAWSIRPTTASSNNGRATILLEDSQVHSSLNIFLNNIWCHITVTWDDTNVRLYRNGGLIETLAQPVGTYRTTNTDTLNIGALRSNAGIIARANTYMDDIRLYNNRVLTAIEVHNLYELSSEYNRDLLNRFKFSRYMFVDGGSTSTYSRRSGTLFNKFVIKGAKQ